MKNGLIVRGVLLSYSLAMIAQVSLPISAMAQQVRTAPVAVTNKVGEFDI